MKSLPAPNPTMFQEMTAPQGGLQNAETDPFILALQGK